MSGYLRPTSAPISDSWQGHKNRTPPSQEPGTDYACAYGTNLVAPAAGRIVVVQTSTSGATGRFLTIDLDDGRRVRWLHLSAVLVTVGARVTAGQAIARSGASAWGKEWGVGAHVHVSLFPTHSYGGFGTSSTLDFEQHIGGTSAGGASASTTQSEEDIMDELIEINGKIYLLGNGTVKHCETPAHVNEMKARTGIPHTKLTAANRLDQWARALDMHGVPRDVFSANGYVLNPETGKNENGALWSWERVNKALLTRLLAKR